jgi:hypothetical protein
MKGGKAGSGWAGGGGSNDKFNSSSISQQAETPKPCMQGCSCMQRGHKELSYGSTACFVAAFRIHAGASGSYSRAVQP